jgi:hypothetical protein
VNHYVNGDTNLKISDISLNKKERDNYAAFPPFCSEWHQSCFEHAASVKAASSEAGNPPAASATSEGPDNTADTDAESAGGSGGDDGGSNSSPETPERKVKQTKPKSSSVKPAKAKRAAKIDAADLASEDDSWDE